MRVLTFSHPGAVVPSITLGRQRALEALGHEVLCIDRAGLDLKSAADYVALARRIMEFGPDLALFYGFTGLICVQDEDGRKVPLLEKLKIPYAAILSNLTSFNTRAVLSIESFVDLDYLMLFVSDRFYKALFDRMGFKHVFFTDLAVSEHQFFPLDQSDPRVVARLESYRAEVSFCGSTGNPAHVTQRFDQGVVTAEVDFLVSEALNYNYRFTLLDAVKSVPVACYGQTPDSNRFTDNISWRGWAASETLNDIYNASRIVLNMTHPFIHGCVPTRVFDTMAAGALCVCDYRMRIAEMFEEGREIVFYRHPAELDGILRHYLEHEDERRRIAAAGHSKVTSAHTWRERMRQTLEVISREFASA